MTINHLMASHLRAAGIQRAEGEKDSKVKSEDNGAATNSRSDKVEISPEGRVLSSQGSDGPDEGAGLTPERLAEVLQRMDAGTYDAPEVAEEVARQILISGDLDL
jgi:hypothetical protein